MAEIPSDVVVILFVCRRLNRQGKIPAANPCAFITLYLPGHLKSLRHNYMLQPVSSALYTNRNTISYQPPSVKKSGAPHL